MIPFPAYGNSLWQRRIGGERIRVVALLVGNRWKVPKPYALPAEVPRLATKTAPWHKPTTTRYDWRGVRQCTVLAFDCRGPDEREAGPDDWDPWLWLLNDVQRQARDVYRITPTEEFYDPPGAWAPERVLSIFAWLSRTQTTTGETRPPWWSADNDERAALALRS